MIICFIAHFYSPFSRQVFIVLPANKTCASLLLLAKVSSQPPFAKGDCLSCSVRANSDRLGRRHKLLVGGQPTISCTPGKTVRDGKECGWKSKPNNCFSTKLRESKLTTSDQRHRAQPNIVSHSLVPII